VKKGSALKVDQFGEKVQGAEKEKGNSRPSSWRKGRVCRSGRHLLSIEKEKRRVSHRGKKA